MAEMQHRSKHNAEDEIASPRNRVNGNADPHSRIVRNAKLCVLILLFIILPSCKHGSCKECRSLVGQNDRYKYSNTKCNYFHQKFCKFRKYFLPGVVAFEDFRKASFLISASHTSSQPLTLHLSLLHFNPVSPAAFYSPAAGNMPGCLIARMPGCSAAWLPGCLSAWLPVCSAARMLGCLIARMPGCLIARLPGCPDAWLPDCPDEMCRIRHF